ncbi:hypothetical protein Ami103574_12945 [Aminipila butyrica]|uniref:Uncharacterized protein n=1 Tax=Aminipila butyrica TaxID=433296 RepID=A0A858BVQ7_9FIRM|nr:hypothetical protein [Aminipila butyrica]QIB70141.1 hypothetical protein Ami103574_12945 [Aminipila butyrica]
MTGKKKGEQGKCFISKLLYVVAALVAVLGIGMLAANVYVFKTTVDQYVMQGYPAAMVMSSMIPSQLLPSIFEALGMYGGITCALVGLGAANKKLSVIAAGAACEADDEEAVDEELENQEEGTAADEVMNDSQVESNQEDTDLEEEAEQDK